LWFSKELVGGEEPVLASDRNFDSAA